MEFLEGERLRQEHRFRKRKLEEWDKHERDSTHGEHGQRWSVLEMDKQMRDPESGLRKQINEGRCRHDRLLVKEDPSFVGANTLAASRCIS